MPLQFPGRMRGAQPVPIEVGRQELDLSKFPAPPPRKPDIFEKIEGWFERGAKIARSTIELFHPTGEVTKPEPSPMTTTSTLGTGFLLLALGVLLALGGFARRRAR